MSTFHATAHGFSSGDPVVFYGLEGGAGLAEGVIYYVRAGGLTADDFTVAETLGGAEVDFAEDITAGFAAPAGTYAALDDGNMTPPDAPVAPSGLSVTPAVVMDADGQASSWLDIAFTPVAASASARGTHVVVTVGGQTITHVVPPTSSSLRIPVPGNVAYSVVAKTVDVFSQESTATGAQVGTTAADTTAPSQVTGASATGGILALFVKWTASSASDLSHYEVQVDTSSGFGTATTYKVKTTLLSVLGLTAGVYYSRIRAVDLTGNAGTYSSTVSDTVRTIQTADVTADAITAALIAAGAVGSSELAAGAVIAGKITAGTIVAADIAAGTITGDRIAANTIAAANIVAGTITATELAANSVTAAKLYITDDSGTTVLTGAGFAGSWLDFLVSGFSYNTSFNSGDTSDIAVTEVSSGDNTAHYLASIGSHLPYWVVAASDGTVCRVADANATGGYALKMLVGVGQTNRIYQDIPVPDAQFQYTGFLLDIVARVAACSAGTITTSVYTSFRDADHVIIGSRTNHGTLTSDNGDISTSYSDEWSSGGTYVGGALGAPPQGATYFRVEIEVVGDTAAQELRLDWVQLLRGYSVADVGNFASAIFAGSANISGNLTVTGAASDRNGTMLPPGTIVAYVGDENYNLPSGWKLCDGTALNKADYPELFAAISPKVSLRQGHAPTITIASPAVVTTATHDLHVGDAVQFSTTGALPTGITAYTTYYIIATGFTADAFRISATKGGAAINTSGTQSGVHEVYDGPYGQAATTFNVPDFRARFLLGMNLAGSAGATGYNRGETGGVLDHTHGVGTLDGTANALTGGAHASRSSGTLTTVGLGHTHPLTLSGSTALNNPPYATVNFLIRL